LPFSANQLFASAPGVFLVGSGVQGLAAPVFLQLSSPGTIRIGDATYAPLGMTIGGGVSRPGGGDLSGVSPRRAFRPRATLRMSELLLRVSSSNLQGVVAHGLIAVPTGFQQRVPPHWRTRQCPAPHLARQTLQGTGCLLALAGSRPLPTMPRASRTLKALVALVNSRQSNPKAQ